METILQEFKNVKKTGNNQYQASCPAHNDKKPSLSINIDDKKVLLHCFAGCTPEEIVKSIDLEMKDLYKNANTSSISRKLMRQCDTSKKSTKPTGLTLMQYGKTKKFSKKFLTKYVKASERELSGGKYVLFPYHDKSGQVIANRKRLSLHGKNKFRWEKGDKLNLYGLDHLDSYKGTFIYIVEGESDCHTLWYKKLPALGVPGVTNWKEDRDAEYFEKFKTVYVIYEQDKGGDTLISKLKESAIAPKIKVVSLGKYKDVSEMYIASAEQFIGRLKKSVKKSVALNEFEDPSIKKRRTELFKRCRDIAEHKDILSLFYKDLQACGVVGEKKYVATVFLCLNTRFFDKIVSLIVRGASSSGKSFPIERILKKFFPKSACLTLTSMSPKALMYTDENFKNRFIWIFEESGINNSDLEYHIRTLLSEGCLKSETTVKGKNGQFTTQKIKKGGPTGFIVTTTKIKYNEENENRCLTVTTDDSPEQSRIVLESIAKNKKSDIDTTAWIAFHEWLELSEHTVKIPYSIALVELIDSKVTRIRRDFTKIISLIECHAMLHQLNRESDSDGRIIANFFDYKVVRCLINDSLSASLENTVPVHIRETVDAVKIIFNKKNRRNENEYFSGVTCLELAEELDINKSTVHRRVNIAEDLGYIEDMEFRPKATKKLKIGEKMPNDEKLLPSVKKLESHYIKIQKRK
ncbi:MAG: winged helix-turn-helix transcriptional regulator [archaeon]|nr:winged helix-turn-helix transcriptional regulator [archaeon]